MASSQLSFLDFPAPVRQRIYSYLLGPRLGEEETVINYALRWNWLDKPSNTTFGGIPQIDICRCPRRKQRTKNSKTRDHFYERYKCYGPEVRFNAGREELWVPSANYAMSGPINFPRPATRRELRKRPNANILSTCRTIYQEALPVLYSGRNFLLLTGPCPRGRYQAYATQKFFMRLSMPARAQVTEMSLNVVAHEEDSSNDNVRRAYSDLATWVQWNLPAIESFNINLWDKQLARIVEGFADDQADSGSDDTDAERNAHIVSGLRIEEHREQDVHSDTTWIEVPRRPDEIERSRNVSAEISADPQSLLAKWRIKDEDKIKKQGERECAELGEHEEGGESDELGDAVMVARSPSVKSPDGWELI